MPGNRDKTGKFRKGSSGNPSGRPKVPEGVKKMLKEATPEAAKLLIETVTNENAGMNFRLDAAKEILNRVYGKASQPIDGDLDATLRVVLEDELKDYAE